jgi:hypothetical protein
MNIKVAKKKTDEEMKRLENTFIKPSDIDTIIRDDATVYTEDGKLLFLFRKKKLTGGQAFYDVIADYMKKHPSTNRGTASGSTSKNTRDNPKVQTTITGYFDRWSPIHKYLFKKKGIKTPIEVRETAFLADHPDEFQKMVPFIEQIDRLYKKYLPEYYEKQYKKAKETHFKIGDTSFSSTTINLNFTTTIHKDKGDDEDGYGNLCTIQRGNYTGSETCFPQYGIGVDVREGDILLMDVHEWHANLPIKLEKGAERMSVVCYLRKKLWERTRNKSRAFMKRHNKTVKSLKERIS